MGETEVQDRSASTANERPEWQESDETWLGSPVRCMEGTLDELREALPTFRREPFGRRRVFGHRFGENKTKDVILRTGAGPAVPVGVG